MIKTCNHVLCKDCVNERIQSRSRKCPHCLKPFGINDSVPVHLV
jgi:E3 ubiquitin-protein ligase BRE1